MSQRHSSKFVLGEGVEDVVFPMWAFDAIVPPLATAAAIGTCAASLVDARHWNSEGTGTLSHWPYVMMGASSGGWIVYGLASNISSIVVSNMVGGLIAITLCYMFVHFSRSLSPDVLFHMGGALTYVLGLSLVAYTGLVGETGLGTICR